MRRSLASVSLLLLLGSAVPAVAGMWPNEVDRVAEQIRSEDVAERRDAARRLARLPKASGDKLLSVALTDDDVQVRVAAAEAALAFHWNEAPRLLVPWLSDRETELRLTAARVLARFPATRESVQALGRALSDPDVEVREAVARALGQSAHDAAVLSLLGHLDESNLQVQLEVIEALIELRDDRAVVPLVGKVQDARPKVREAVARALGVFSGERVNAALVLLLRDGDNDVRLAAVSSLGRLRNGDSLDALLHVLAHDESLDVRATAVNALARTGLPRAAKALVELLDGPREELIGEAERALQTMGKVAVPELFTCLSGQPSRRRGDACARALAASHQVGVADALSDAWLRRVISASAALDAFAELGDPQGLPIVLESLTDDDPWVRSRAARAAQALLSPERPDGRAVEPLLQAAKRAADRPEELLTLLALLGRTGSVRVAPTLAQYATSESPRLRLVSVKALGQVRATQQQDLLLRLLDDSEPRVRQEAALALRRAANTRVLAPLLERLDHASENEAAWLALAFAGPLSHVNDEKLLGLVEARLNRSPAKVRDALIESLAAAKPGLAGPALGRAARQLGARSRAKVAEVLAGVPGQGELLIELLDDARGETRANAAWALGFVGVAKDLPRLAQRFDDRYLHVAANAAASYGRLAAAIGGVDGAPLCRLLMYPEPAVRANALAGLRLMGARCEGQARELLQNDPSPLVRLSAAELLRARGAAPEDETVLARCLDEEKDGRVARACAAAVQLVKPASSGVIVFVFSETGEGPRADMPFALRFSDGTLRHGTSDRRGAVSEARPPSGALTLETPFALGTLHPATFSRKP